MRIKLATQGISALTGMLDLMEQSPLTQEEKQFVDATRKCVKIIEYRRDHLGLPVNFAKPVANCGVARADDDKRNDTDVPGDSGMSQR